MDTYVISLTPKTIDDARPEARPLLEAAQKQYGMIPNMYARMANVPDVLGTYLYGHERFRKHSGFTLAEQEVILLTISYENGCSYCMAAHSWVAQNVSKVPADAIEAIRTGKEIADPKLAALTRFTATMVRTCGNPAPQDAQRFLEAGFSEVNILEIILAIAVKILSNYSNHIFHTPVDAPFAACEWKQQAADVAHQVAGTCCAVPQHR
jgi:uncharacterized peroxidase-related enzyme